MIVASLLLFAVAQAQQAPSWDAPVGAVRLTARVRAESVPAVARPVPRAVADTPVVSRPRAIEYSDMYFTRLTIHRIGSYTMLPLFVAEYSLGQNLMQDASPPGWMKPAHGVVAGGVAVLFGVNTITGLWNLWDARDDPDGRTRRTVHSVLMLVADAGFAATGALAPEKEDDGFVNYGTYLHRVRVHRGVAIGSFALSTVGSAMMWFWKQ
jgi:hypothetical protein